MQDTIPTPHDLAKSFLEQEPAKEKAQLQAEMEAHSQDLQQSAVTASDVSDDDAGFGTGMYFTLPGFLAGFFKGISDRLQVMITEVSISVDTESDIAPEDFPRDLDPSTAVQLTTGLVIDRIDVRSTTLKIDEGVANQDRTSGEPFIGEESRYRRRRRVTLNQVRAYFCANENNSQPPKVPNVTNTRDESESPAYSWSQHQSSHPFQGRLYENADGIIDDESKLSPVSQSKVSLRMGESILSSEGGNLADVEDDPESDGTRSMSHAMLPDSRNGFLPSRSLASRASSLASSEESSQSVLEHKHNALKNFRYERAGATQSESKFPSRTPPRPRYQRSPRTASPPAPIPGGFWPESIHSGTRTPTPRRTSDDEKIMNEDSSQSPSPENGRQLFESTIFSHEDAESIYMSLVNQDSEHAPRRMPGEWGESTIHSARVSGEDKISSGPTSWISDVSLEKMGGDAVQPGEKSHGVSQPRQKIPAKEMQPGEGQQTSGRRIINHRKRGTELFTIDRIDVELPDLESAAAENVRGDPERPSTHAKSPFRDNMMHQDVPGSFSMYAGIVASERRSVNFDTEALGKSKSAHPTSNLSFQNLPGHPNRNVEIALGDCLIQVDISSAKVLGHLSKIWHDFFNRYKAKKSSSAPSSTKVEEDRSDALSLSLRSLSLAIRPGSGINTALGLDKSLEYDNAQSTQSLFGATLKNLKLDFSNSESFLDVERMQLELANHDIVSFGTDPATQASMLRGQSLPQKALSANWRTVNNAFEVNVSTLPLRVDLDFFRLDEMLATIGGISGIVELGSSMLSETLAGRQPQPEAHTKCRAVRFDTSAKPPKQDGQSGRAKINVRLGGALVDLKCKATTITLQSSAIKSVCRDSLTGIQVDQLRLIGPCLDGQKSSETAKLIVSSLGIKYLPCPEECDLTRLIDLLNPSRDKFEDEDDYLLDTLIRQRKKGAVMRCTMSTVEVKVPRPGNFDKIREFLSDISQLSAVTKYLPEESRPGVMTLGLIHDVHLDVQEVPRIGRVELSMTGTEVAHVSVPSLMALSVDGVGLKRQDEEDVVHSVVSDDSSASQPMLMARMIGEEMEPTLKIKLWNACVEYSVPLIASILSDAVVADQQRDLRMDLARSVANIGDTSHSEKSDTKSPASSRQSAFSSRSLKIDVTFRDCAIGLSPKDLKSKGIFLLTNACFCGTLPKNEDFDFLFEIRKASLLLTDEVKKKKSAEDETWAGRARNHSSIESRQISELNHQGFVSVSWISAARFKIRSEAGKDDSSSALEIDVQDELLVLETCADSTQTLTELLGALSPPRPPTEGDRYRTQVAPVEDMMASFTGDAFAAMPERVLDPTQDVAVGEDSEFDNVFEGMEDVLGNVENVDDESDYGSGSLFNSAVRAENDVQNEVEEKPSPDMEQSEMISGGFKPAAMPSQIEGTASKWNSTTNRYIPVTKSQLRGSPLKLKVKDVHFIWNLHDGYDWSKTREALTKAVDDVEAKAEERRSHRKITKGEDEDDESVIGDFLFNSIYIGIPVSNDPRELSGHVNKDMDDLITETGSQATATTARLNNAQSSRRSHSRRLRLERSKRHKLTFELCGVSADFFLYGPGGETSSSTDIKIKSLDIFDHVPSSTWKKFATYMHDSGPREDKKAMIHLEICEVRPVPELTATELVIRATVLPLRLHVDQDTLDFMARFFDFDDGSSEVPKSSGEQPYLQRVEIRDVPVKLDYKPKKVDYAGIRSGRTTELMNFFILDAADLVLRHTIVYGCPNFAKLHKSLEDVWMPDIRQNQLPSVLSGLNGVRTIVNVGSGVRNLVEIPIREYRKDGRVVRSVSKGAIAFARTTGSELTKFGAKLAVGAQAALQGAEDFLAKAPTQKSSNEGDWEMADMDHEERRVISPYADQPAGILQGLKGAARSLERDLLVTKDVIIAVSGEARESGSAEGVARAVVRNAPTLVLRPMIGASRAISQTLMGATNTVDPQNRRRVEDVSSPISFCGDNG